LIYIIFRVYSSL